MALALNNLQKVDMPLNKETKSLIAKKETLAHVSLGPSHQWIVRYMVEKLKSVIYFNEPILK